jgi:hypothetical protein
MPSRSRKLVPVALALVTALALSACGSSHTRVTTGTYAGESGASAPYLDVGPLVYQVQLSRQLNPTDSEDAGYLEGLTPAQRLLPAGQEWFAVFMQVYNHNAFALPASTAITIYDTQGNVYAPIVPDLSNPYAYRGGAVPAEGMIPELDTTSSFGPTQGSLLLYKINTVSLDNRPIKVKIESPSGLGQTASAVLDV